MDRREKESVVHLLKSIWDSDEFKLIDTDRTRRLRKELLTRLLAQVMTDDERAALYSLPAGCRVRENAKILSPEEFKCGENVWVGEGAIIDASGGLEVGQHTTIGSGCYVWSHSSVLSSLMMDNSSGNSYILRRKTKIGSGTFIGGPSVVYPGVTIGSRCVVLPMSVVTDDVPDGTMVGGAPARRLRDVDDEYLREMLQSRTTPPIGDR